MQCYLRNLRGSWYAVFECGGSRFTASLRTKDEIEAQVRLGPIRDRIYRIENGTLPVPEGEDLRAFVVSGGAAARPKPAPKTRLGELAGLYLEAMRNLEANTKTTARIHLNHASRILGVRKPLGEVDLSAAERYAAARLAERRKGRPNGPRTAAGLAEGRAARPITAYTVKKELTTLRAALAWAAGRGLAASAPGWTARSVSMPKDRSREPFRTYDQIVELCSRRGDAPPNGPDPWECLFLTGEEVRGLLAYVEDRAAAPWVHPMFAFVAMTGCRRSEMARSLREDWDLAASKVRIREKKRDRERDLTFREVDVHPDLAEVMRRWFGRHPGGPWTITADGRPLRVDTATARFRKTLAPDPKWSKVRGFHVLRHSLASILASEGVEPLYIDGVLGHQTLEMRRRYQHLFPDKLKSAIGRLFASTGGAGRDSGSEPAPRAKPPIP